MNKTSTRHVLIALAATAAQWAMPAAQASLRTPTLSTLSTGESTNGTLAELWLAVVDTVGEASYALDLGITIAMVRQTNADRGSLADLAPPGNNISATFQKASDASNDYAFWIIDPARDLAWGQFMSATTSLASANWTVMSADAIGPSSAGNRALLLTVSQGQEAAFRTVGNATVTSGNAQASAFATNVNTRPGHAVESDVTGDLESSIAINGSSFDTKAEHPDAYFGKFQADSMGTGLPSTSNAIGQSAWFYDLSRSSSSNLSAANVDEFDNLAGDAYWGFSAEAGSTGRYLLSYVMPRFLSTTETAAGLTFENSFAHLAGVLSLASPAGQSGSVIGMAEGFVRRLAARSVAQGLPPGPGGAQILSVGRFAEGVSPVPEPASALLVALGLAGLLGLARRRGQGC